MFFQKKKNTTSVDLSWLHTDIHSHLLPGIDDGVQDMETSLELIKGLAEMGIQKIVTTPHILWEIYPNTPEIIKSKTDEVRHGLAEAKMDIELHSAAEYFIDDYFEQNLKNKTPLLTIRHKVVLVEFSMITAPLDWQEIIFEMQIQNYQPLLAHPERYVYMKQKKEFYDQLKDMGCFFQLNLLSLTGYYGKAVQEIAEYLIKKDYYNFAGTDMHNARHLAALQKLTSSASFKKVQDSGTIKNHLL